MQTYTPAHTHATLQGLHTCELVAELVICDALQLVGRGEFGSVSVSSDSSFVPLLTFRWSYMIVL